MDYSSYFDLMKGSFTIIILLLCSIIALKVIIEKYIVFKSINNKFITGFLIRLNHLIKDKHYDKAKELLSNEKSRFLFFEIKFPFTSVYRYIIDHPAVDKDMLLQSSYTKLDKESARLEKGLGTLATLGSISPFIGLFGTVVGIIHAFSSLSVGDISNYNDVMSGIAEALICTAAGILVAVPSVIFYNHFIRKIKLSLPIVEDSVQEAIFDIKG